MKTLENILFAKFLRVFTLSTVFGDHLEKGSFLSIFLQTNREIIFLESGIAVFSVLCWADGYKNIL